MNNKGFMMAEVVVVSAVILVTLTSLYISYGKILSLYNQRIDYYDVTTLYELANIRDNYPEEIKAAGSTGVVINEDTSIPSRVVYYVDINEITDMMNDSRINPKFADYFKYLSTSLKTSVNSILVMERCIDKDGDDCKYAYLEVFESWKST